MLLIKYGLESNPQNALLKTINYVRGEMMRANIDEPFRFTAICTNGTHLIAVRYSSDSKAPSLFYRQSELGTTIVSEPLDEHYSDWVMAEPSSIATVDSSNTLNIEKIEL